MKTVFVSLVIFNFCVLQKVSGQAELLTSLRAAIDNADSKPNQMTTMGGILYFVADDGIHGQELWRSDRTEAGTTMVKDIYPGINGSAVSSLTIINDNLFFAAADSEHGKELWKTNGTAEGTVLVKDVLPGARGSNPKNLAALNTLLFFDAYTPDKGREPWISNGEAEGTIFLKDIYPGTSSSEVSTPTFSSSNLYFGATNPEYGHELWKTDGTLGGTAFVSDTNPGPDGAQISNMIDLDDKLIFTSIVPRYDAIYGNDLGYFEVGTLWITNGFPNGTEVIYDLAPGSRGTYPSHFTLHAGEIYFLHQEALNNTFQPQVLWKTNGTESGTRPVEDVANIKSYSAQGLISFAGYLYFLGSKSPGTFDYQLCKTDGSPNGSTAITPLGYQSTKFTSKAIGNKLYLISQNVLYMTSEEGPIEEIARFYSRYDVALNPSGVFLGGTISQFYTVGHELWFFDVASEKFNFIKDINRSRREGSQPHDLKIRNGDLYFLGDGDLGKTLFKTDGSPNGTHTVQVANIGAYEVVNDVVYLGIGNSLFKKINNDTLFIKTIQHQWTEGYINKITSFNNFLFIEISTGGGSSKQTVFWISDGTTDGTSYFPFYPDAYATLNNILIFKEFYGDLYKTDGTISGTTLIKKFQVPQSIYQTTTLLAVNGFVYLNGYTDEYGYELWKTDGTEAGTSLVKDIYPGNRLGMTQHLVHSGSDLYFVANDGTHGYELWKSDGTEQGTMLVKDISSDNATGYPGGEILPFYHPLTGAVLTAVDNIIYFSATDGIHGFELWSSDGTEEGTAMVEDFNVGSADFAPHQFTKINDKILFIANEGDSNTEQIVGNFFVRGNPKLWEFDGHQCRLVTGDYILAGEAVALNTVLIFTADGVAGRELFYYAVPASPVTNVVSEVDDDTKVYPNPSTAIFYVDNFSENANVSYRISNSLGKILASGDAYPDAGRIAIDMSPFPAGIYFLIIDSKKTQSLKLFKK